MPFVAGCVVYALAVQAGPLVFLDPGQLERAQGVEIRAQEPESQGTLLAADPDHPKLWYSPAAALPGDHGVHIWYQRVDSGQAAYSDQRTLCMGYLRAGEWETPALSPEPVPWGGPNNVVMRRSPHKPTWGGFNVFQIIEIPAGYAMLYWDQPAVGNAGALLARSADGVRWERVRELPVFTEHNDAYSLIHHPGAQRYVVYQTQLEPWPDKPYADNLPGHRRIQSLRESADLVTWSQQTPILRPDAQDPPETEFYLLTVFPYGGQFAGLLFKYYADPAAPNRHSAIYRHELVVSDNGRDWIRPFRDTNLGFWTYAQPFHDRGNLCFVYSDGGAMAIARYRPHGLTAAEATETGQFTTPPLPWAGLPEAVSADAAAGWAVFTLLDQAGTPIAGVEPIRIAFTTGDRIPLRWPPNYGPQSGGPYRLHVRLHAAKLYAIYPAGQ